MKMVLSMIVVLHLGLFSIATADEVSHRAAAEELLKITKVDQLMKPLFEQVKSMMDQQFSLMGVPEDKRPVLKKYTDRLLSMLEEEFGWEKIKDDYVRMYVETFSEKEIRSFSAFYQTPEGQVFIEKMPMLMKKAFELSQKKMPEMMKRIQQITNEIMEDMKNEIKSG